jgi:hypothetical protein
MYLPETLAFSRRRVVFELIDSLGHWLLFNV